MQDLIISASILSADFAHLAEDTDAVLAAGAQHIHFDVMDHHFVPNLSFGALVCKALRNAKITAPIDVHLMVDDPTVYIEPFAKAGASLITFHPETVDDVSQTIAAIKNTNMQAGLTFNPDQPVNIDSAVLSQLDMVLLMSVNPGFGGQKFLPSVLTKIGTTRALLDKNNSKARLGIDGGINKDNVHTVTAAGADYLVIGSGLFSATDYAQRMQDIVDNVTAHR